MADMSDMEKEGMDKAKQTAKDQVDNRLDTGDKQQDQDKQTE